MLKPIQDELVYLYNLSDRRIVHTVRGQTIVLDANDPNGVLVNRSIAEFLVGKKGLADESAVIAEEQRVIGRVGEQNYSSLVDYRPQPVSKTSFVQSVRDVLGKTTQFMQGLGANVTSNVNQFQPVANPAAMPQQNTVVTHQRGNTISGLGEPPNFRQNQLTMAEMQSPVGGFAGMSVPPNI